MKGSVRSLPPNRMHNIRQMFDRNPSVEHKETDMKEDTDSYVRTAQSKFEPKEEDSSTPTTRWRQHITPPREAGANRTSPTRLARQNKSPSRPPEMLSGFPVPSPRSSLKKRGSTEDAIEHGLSNLPIAKFGGIAGIVADTGQDSGGNRVSRLIGQLQSANITGNSARDPSPNKIPMPVPSPANRQTKFLEKDGSTPVIVVGNNNESQANLSSLSVRSGIGDKRPVSVVERSRLFENIHTSPSTTAASNSSSQKPVRPSPPFRQRSISGGKSGGDKIPPKRPAVRQRSYTDDISSDKSSDQKPEEADTKVTKVPMKPPMPPSKPQRTFAHDDYIKVKLEKGAENVTYQSAHANKASESNENIEVSNQSDNRKHKPLRPPPPRKKKRPFSIATDTIMDFRSSDGSDSSDASKNGSDNSGFYDTVRVRRTESHEGSIKHWDLPRMSHPEPIRRSLSDDCIHKHDKAVDNEGNVVYMDPEQLAINVSSGYDIYVDTEGYAVPNRLVRRNKSSTDEEIETARPIGDRVKSKFRRFKNLFSEQDKTPPASKGPLDRGSQKRRLDIIKQKVSQAFEVIGARLHRDSETFSEESEEEEETATDDADSRVNERERRKRVEYSRSVRLKTSKSIREAKKYTQKIYPQLFEHAMIVGLKQSDTGEYEPYVRYKFPEIKDSNVSIPLFCFPDAASFKPSSSSSKSQSYHFVLTNFDGGRVYGYCRRLLPPKSPNKTPEVICIISPVDAFSMYNSLLEKIEEKRVQSKDAAQELIAASFGRPLPSPGLTETIRTLDIDGEMETFFISRETDNRVDNVNCECVLSTLGSDKFLKVFASILLERSVLFCSKQLGPLSSTIHALTSLLYPFSWQHTFIPVLPATMVDVVCSPTPFIIGIPTSLINKAMALPLDENVLVVDLDKRSFLKSQGDEGTLLPPKIEKALKTSLNMCRVDSDAKMSPNLMISEAFMRFFVEAVGHYGNHILTHENGQRHFQKEEFLKDRNSQPLQDLLEWFVETQMFEVFVSTQLEKKEWGNTLEFFQSRVQEYRYIGNRNSKQRRGKKVA